jgi:hypothetical protein
MRTTQQVERHSMINVLTHNHGNCVHVQDQLEYVVDGLRSVNCRAGYSDLRYGVDAINIVLEGSYGTFSEQVADARRHNPNSRLFMIVTEVLSDEGFNSANARHEDKHQLYSNRKYWSERTQDFYKILPALDGIITVSEELSVGYARLDTPAFYLPLAAPPRHVPIERFPREEQDIDVIFTGTLTGYRKQIIKQLEGRGLSVVHLSPKTPDFLRRHYFQRAKLSIGLKLEPDTRILSKFRAHYHLVNHIPHLFEFTAGATDLHQFINFCRDSDRFVETCVQMVRNNPPFPEGIFSSYETSEALNHQRIFRDLKNFLHA